VAADLDPDALSGVENTSSGDPLAAPNGGTARDLLRAQTRRAALGDILPGLVLGDVSRRT
jgi:hypothetical protein